jgi:hypothetical protein
MPGRKPGRKGKLRSKEVWITKAESLDDAEATTDSELSDGFYI